MKKNTKLLPSNLKSITFVLLLRLLELVKIERSGINTGFRIAPKALFFY